MNDINEINLIRVTGDSRSLYVYGNDDDYISLCAVIQDANQEIACFKIQLVMTYGVDEFLLKRNFIKNFILPEFQVIPITEFLRDFKKCTVSSLVRGEYEMNAQEYTDEELIKISRVSSSPVTKELGYRLQRLLETIKKLTGDKAK